MYGKMQVLNKKEKEELVIKLHQENKTISQIAEIVHMSFKDIDTIIRRIKDHDNDKYIDTKLRNKSKETKALWLFEQKKRPIDVAIELDIP
jgi:transposase